MPELAVCPNCIGSGLETCGAGTKDGRPFNLTYKCHQCKGNGVISSDTIEDKLDRIDEKLTKILLLLEHINE